MRRYSQAHVIAALKGVSYSMLPTPQTQLHRQARSIPMREALSRKLQSDGPQDVSSRISYPWYTQIPKRQGIDAVPPCSWCVPQTETQKTPSAMPKDVQENAKDVEMLMPYVRVIMRCRRNVAVMPLRCLRNVVMMLQYCSNAVVVLLIRQ